MKYPKRTSPTIDKLAKEGVLFTQAISNGCATQASFPAILTSTYFSKYNDIPYLSENRMTITEVLKDNSYSTAAFHSNAWLSRNFNYDKGFDTFVDFEKRGRPKTKEEIDKMDADIVQSNIIRHLKDISKRRLNPTNPLYKWSRKLYRYYSYKVSLPYVKAEIVNRMAKSWLEENSPDKFFLWLHYMDVHVPYKPPSEYIKRFHSKNINDFKKIRLIESPKQTNSISKKDFEALIALYDSSIYYVDQCIGKFLNDLKEFGVYNDTLIIITADHGEQFNDHGEFYHNPPKLYDELIHVPLIMFHVDDSFEERIIKHQVELLDLSPTIIDYLENKSIGNFQGKSLMPTIRGEEEKGSSGVISETAFSGRKNNLPLLISYRTEKWKYIIDMEKKELELYNLQDDPGEITNVIAEYPEQEEHFESLLSQHISNANQEPVSTPEINIDEKIKERLRMLGYLD